MSSLLGFNRVRWTSVENDEVAHDEETGSIVDDSDHVPDVNDSTEFVDRDQPVDVIIDIGEDDDTEEEDDLEDVRLAGDEEEANETTAVVTPLAGIPRMTLRELEEERNLARQRTSACVLLAVFFLFRLWIEALAQADLGLLMLCLVGTSWCARWIRHNREREEELDRRIATYSQTLQNDPEGATRPDLRMLSFQAQLALALMESQRTMMQGGFGHPDGQPANTGVTDETREQWSRLKFKDVKTVETSTYETVAQDDEPTCSICLCEYEQDDDLVQLPCGHEYHDDCITSWTNAHSKCPLCNMDLESVAETETSD